MPVPETAQSSFRMSSSLDRFLGGERRFNWRYALRIVLITAAFQAACLLVVSIVVTAVPYLRGFYFHEMIAVLIPALLRQYGPATPLRLVIWTGIFMLPYWAVFVLAALSDETNAVHRWRVWLAWLLMTLPFAVVYSYAVFLTSGFSLWVFSIAYPLPLTALSPLVTLLAVVADHLTRQFLRWLRHDDRSQSSSLG